MKITFDRSVNAVYIRLTSTEPIGPLHMYACDPKEVGGMINLDFDSSGVLVGIEVIGATSTLPEEFLKLAEMIG